MQRYEFQRWLKRRQQQDRMKNHAIWLGSRVLVAVVIYLAVLGVFYLIDGHPYCY